MTKTYLKSYTIPKTWGGILKKQEKYTMRPNPNGRSQELVMPLGVIFKSLKLAKTTKEVKNILQHKKVLVNSKKVRDEKFAIGFTDVLDVEELRYRCNLNERGKLTFEPEKENYNLKPVKIINKTRLKGGKTQLNFDDGSNKLIEDAKKYKVGDTLVLELPKKEIKEAIELKSGAKIMLIKGKHAGTRGVLKEIKGKKATYEYENTLVETLKDYIFVMPKIIQ